MSLFYPMWPKSDRLLVDAKGFRQIPSLRFPSLFLSKQEESLMHSKE